MAARLGKLVGERVKAVIEGDAGWRKGIFSWRWEQPKLGHRSQGNGVGCVKD